MQVQDDARRFAPFPGRAADADRRAYAVEVGVFVAHDIDPGRVADERAE
ncbi:hypothetical protein SDC9_197744 [bioreactor metagenome]|uniref:Uncharacterized protein n=1 Tax=bioreactor metagenome TaxID=1076179 RepID=A0A645IFN8_9ZZZZ